MFFKTFMTSAVVAFVAVVIASVAILPEFVAQEPHQVDFITAPPTAAAPSAPADALEAAQAHEQGLTDCVDPSRARLDDVILTVPSEPLAGAVITQVGFDEALESGELGRWNVLACKPAGRATGASAGAAAKLARARTSPT